MSEWRLEGIENLYSNRSIQILRKLGDDPGTKERINEIIKDAITPFIPMGKPEEGGGTLREDVHVYPDSIVWGEGPASRYAQYQHTGEVWVINYPIHEKGNPNHIIGWRSLPGKMPSGRALGTPGMLDDWVFGYSTDGTMSNWERAYEWSLKSEVNKRITALLKQIYKEETGYNA